MKIKNILRTLLSVCIWLVIWFLAAKKVGLEILLPSPIDTLKALFHLAQTKDFWISCAMSVARISSGLFTGAVLAVLLAAATSASKTVYALFSPILTVIKATPIASFIILALLWIGRENVPAFITLLIVLPIVWSSVYTGIKDIDTKYKEIGIVFNFTKREKIKHIYIPSIFSAFLSSFTTSIGIAWKAGVAAEVLCTPKYSIGTELFESKKYLETADLFAWTATVIILSIIITKLLVWLCSLAAERSGHGKA